MADVTLNLQERLSDDLAELANVNGLNPSYLALLVLRGYIEHERSLTAEIEQAVEEAEEGRFASDDEVAALRARCWNWNAG